MTNDDSGSELTRENTDSEEAKKAILKAFITKEQAKADEIKKQTSPSNKQQLWKSLRSVVEGY